MAKKANNKFADIGLLLLRIGIGGMFIYHGWPKIAGGASGWESLGQSVSALSIPFGFLFWGFILACAEFFGGIFLICGAFIRPFCLLLCGDMIVGAAMHLRNGAGLPAAAYPIEMGIVFLSLVFIGAGEFTFTNMIEGMKKKVKKKK